MPKHILSGQIKPFPIFFEEDEHGGGGDGTRTGGRDQVHVSERAKKFGERFAPPPGTAGIPVAKTEDETPPGLPPAAAETPAVKALREAEAAKGRNEAEAKRRAQAAPKSKPGSNVPAILEAKRLADAAVEKYEKETVPALNSRIEELQNKIDSGDFSPAKEKEFTARIEAIEKAKTEREGELTQELDNTRKRLAAVSIVDDPLYKEKYLLPLGEAIGTIKQIIGTNQVLANGINKAMQANKASLQATSIEERTEYENQRDEILDSVLEGMPTTQSKRLYAAFEKFVEKSFNQALAAADHEKTGMELKKEAEQRFKEGASEAIRIWSAEYDSQAPAFADSFNFTDEEAKIAKDLGVSVDVDAENAFARGAIEGKLEKPDVVKLVHRGRAYAPMAAKVKVLQHMLKEKEETIAKLRGAAPTGGHRSTGKAPVVAPRPGEEAPAVNREGKSREQWQAERFRAPTA